MINYEISWNVETLHERIATSPPISTSFYSQDTSQASPHFVPESASTQSTVNGVVYETVSIE